MPAGSWMMHSASRVPLRGGAAQAALVQAADECVAVGRVEGRKCLAVPGSGTVHLWVTGRSIGHHLLSTCACSSSSETGCLEVELAKHRSPWHREQQDRRRRTRGGDTSAPDQHHRHRDSQLECSKVQVARQAGDRDEDSYSWQSRRQDDERRP